jgi:hypothetical protein
MQGQDAAGRWRPAQVVKLCTIHTLAIFESQLFAVVTVTKFRTSRTRKNVNTPPPPPDTARLCVSSTVLLAVLCCEFCATFTHLGFFVSVPTQYNSAVTLKNEIFTATKRCGSIHNPKILYHKHRILPVPPAHHSSSVSAQKLLACPRPLWNADVMIVLKITFIFGV